MDTTLQEYRAPRPGRVYSRIGIACFVILVVTLLIQYAGVKLTAKYAPLVVLKPWFFWVAAFVPQYVFAVPIGIAILMRAPASGLQPRSVGIGTFITFLVISMGIGYIGNIIGNLINTVIGRLIDTPSFNPVDLLVSQSSFLFKILVMVILAPFIEELIFRKLIIDRIWIYGEGIAVLLSGLMFGLYHGNLYQFFYAFALGAIFAYIYIRTGRLRYPVLLHMLINFMSGVLLPLISGEILDGSLQRLDPSDTGALTEYVMENLPQLLGFIAYVMFLFAVAIAGIVLFIIKRKTFVLESAPLQLAKGTGFKTVFLNVGMILYTLGTLAMMVANLVNYSF
ncbi:MAG: CPBP family intramembrane metalloprotease [Clostridiales bacterium]|nr:CPBP family intramembrane metalloprotease [Clostridiales bacterium]